MRDDTAMDDAAILDLARTLGLEQLVADCADEVIAAARAAADERAALAPLAPDVEPW